MNKVILIIVSCILVSCKSSSVSNNHQEIDKEIQAKPEQLTYLALGDSYTIGEMVHREENFPHQLVNELRARNYNFSDPLIVAKTGWRTDELMTAVNQLNAEKEFDFVSLLIGVNNQYQGKDIAIFKQEFRQLVHKAIQFSKTDKKGVFVFSIPDYSVMPFMNGKNTEKVKAELQAYNKAALSICEELGVKFYNITKISKMAKTDSSLIAKDKLHPSAKMYKLWIMKTVDEIISHHLSS